MGLQGLVYLPLGAIKKNYIKTLLKYQFLTCLHCSYYKCHHASHLRAYIVETQELLLYLDHLSCIIANI